jgi:hypothetical protein
VPAPTCDGTVQDDLTAQVDWWVAQWVGSTEFIVIYNLPDFHVWVCCDACDD